MKPRAKMKGKTKSKSKSGANKIAAAYVNKMKMEKC